MHRATSCSPRRRQHVRRLRRALRRHRRGDRHRRMPRRVGAARHPGRLRQGRLAGLRGHPGRHRHARLQVVANDARAARRDAETCAYNDFALVKVAPRRRRQGQPERARSSAAPPASTPTAPPRATGCSPTATPACAAGSTRCRPRPASASVTRRRRLVAPGLHRDPRACPATPGSGFLSAGGKAVGTLSTLGLAPLPLSNNIGDLGPGARLAKAHSGITGLRLALGTEPFAPDPLKRPGSGGPAQVWASGGRGSFLGMKPGPSTHDAPGAAPAAATPAYAGPGSHLRGCLRRPAGHGRHGGGDAGGRAGGDPGRGERAPPGSSPARRLHPQRVTTLPPERHDHDRPPHPRPDRGGRGRRFGEATARWPWWSSSVPRSSCWSSWPWAADRRVPVAAPTSGAGAGRPSSRGGSSRSSRPRPVAAGPPPPDAAEQRRVHGRGTRATGSSGLAPVRAAGREAGGPGERRGRPLGAHAAGARPRSTPTAGRQPRLARALPRGPVLRARAPGEAGEWRRGPRHDPRDPARGPHRGPEWPGPGAPR